MYVHMYVPLQPSDYNHTVIVISYQILVITVQLNYKVNSSVEYTCVARKFLMSQLISMPWLLTSIIVKYMDIISRVIVQHTTSNLIIMDGPCPLGHRVK